MIGSASLAAAVSGIADTLSILLFTAAFTAGFFTDTVRLRRLRLSRFFAAASIIYLCFIPVDYFLLASGWQRVLLHAIWFAIVVITAARNEADKKVWPQLYLLCSVQWIPVASHPTGAIFWICFALFVFSGIASLMLFELRRPLKIPGEEKTSAGKLRNPLGMRAARPHLIEKCVLQARALSKKLGFRKLPVKFCASSSSAFPYRAFFLAVTGTAAAAAVAAIPFFFIFPRLPVKNAALPEFDADSYYVDSINEIETFELGGTVAQALPDAIVMRVKTDAPPELLPYDLKWRGLSYDYYDGRAWTLRRREQQTISIQGGFYKLEDSAMGSDLLRQTFFMEETLTNTIFAAHRALAISTEAGFLRRDSSDNLSAQNLNQGRQAYVVVSDTIYPDADMISDFTSIPDDIRTTWLQLPELDPRVIQLALEITNRYRRQYDKARSLEIWLSSNYDYNTALSQIPEISEFSESGDPLATFLFDTRLGRCEYFATAMTVMLRAIGIPARISTGFHAGEYNPLSGSWTVRRKHSHAWTEAWFAPYGWVQFDATPMEEFSKEPPRSLFFANLADAAGLWWRENVTGYGAARQHSVISGFFTRVNRAEDRAGEFLTSSANRALAVFHLLPQTAIAVKFAALLVLFAVAFIVFLLRRRTRRRIPGVFHRNKHDTQSAAVDFYAEALIFLKTQGLIPEKSQTPLEFARVIAARYTFDTMLDLTRFYNELRFGGLDVPFQRDKARELLHSLKTSFEKH